jgi:natural product precursor
MKISKKPALRDLQALSYDEMRTIKGGYSDGACVRMPECPYGCGSRSTCNNCCMA